MSYDRDEVWGKSDGYCKLCGKKLSRNIGITGNRGAWQADHSHPKRMGGKDGIRNMNALCVTCNNKKSDIYRSLNDARSDTSASTFGGKVIDGINKIKESDSLLDKLPDLRDGFMGASRKRSWKK